MASYVLFFSFTSSAVQRLMDNPSDRGAVVSKLAESAGGRMVAYYLMFGDWDGMVIMEAPDSQAAAAVSMAVRASGAFERLETHELIETSALPGILDRAKSLPYSAPGA
jgi:uncharacterized protein with GYD domain